jgi:two-component system, sensor histidine kinase and response regulator
MKTILLVDDDQQLRTMFGLALRRKGYHVIEADSGVTGLAVARQHLPDLILSDINMPGGDGSTLLQEMRRDPELHSKQIVLMTGRPDLLSPRKGMEEGADDFLVKPVDLKTLLSCVEARFSRASVSWRVEDQLLTQLRSSVPSNLPHEFFTPLAGIIGLMEILRSDFPGLAPEEVQDIHNDIYQSALRLHRTLRNYLLILDLQSATSEAPTTPLAPGAVKEAIEAGVKEALRQNNRSSDMTVRVQACPISIKPDDLSRTVEELVDNALKFSRQGTPVIVELSADGRLTVTDRGRGLTAEEISRVGAFQQFDRKKNEQQGLGLGLVLVQKLTAQCKAEFSINSQPGKETAVQIAFPSASNA